MSRGGALQVVVIGGGFYGCAIAERAARLGKRVLLFESDEALLQRASYHNQARLHGGYHYPRSFHTANRSRHNFAVFLEDYEEAIDRDFPKLYAIARRRSKVTPSQFERFCARIRAPLESVGDDVLALFNPRLIEAVYAVQEYAIDVAVLGRLMSARLARAGVTVRTGCEVVGVGLGAGGLLDVMLSEGETVRASYVFNCTYSSLNVLAGANRATPLPLKHEFAEMALVRVPDGLAGHSITVLDGPFFSVMPFPARRAWTLSHVRYTPHCSWFDETGDGPGGPGDGRWEGHLSSQYLYMVRDAARYVPILRDVEYIESMYETKTVLIRNEIDDGRPILFDRAGPSGRLISVLGAKLDNVYDVLPLVDEVLEG